MKFNNTKVKVKNKTESEAVQKVMFKLGYGWRADEKEIKYVDEPFLFFDSDGEISYVSEESEEFFINHSNKLITVKQILSGKVIKEKQDDMIRYMVHGIGCNNKSDLLKEESELKEKLRKLSNDSNWTGRISGYKLTPIYEAEQKTILKVFKITKLKKRK